MKIILASKSPRRQELLRQVGIPFETIPSKTEEIMPKAEPQQIVEELSRQKAREVFAGQNAEKELLVIGADTIVVSGGRIMGKPSDEKEAFLMLRELQAHTHSVFTGVTLAFRTDKEKEMVFHEETKVTFFPMTDAEIKNYISTGEPMDKAGAYGIQGKAAAFIEKIEGDYNNVVGLPVGRICQLLKTIGTF